MQKQIKLIGPFKQLVSLRGLPLNGPLHDNQLEIIENAGILIQGEYIIAIGDFNKLSKNLQSDAIQIVLKGDFVALPSYIDCHTHIAFDGDRSNDFAIRNSGGTYLEIAASGGGIWSTVMQTRKCGLNKLKELIHQRATVLLKQGITTIEIKSGYGLNIEQEIKLLRAITQVNINSKIDLVSTCLSAHMLPRDYQGSNEDYLDEIANKLFPVLKAENLSNRIDAFIEHSAFSAKQIRPYFQKAKSMGFDLCVHADQFSTSGSALAVEMKALSADHLESSTEKEIRLLSKSKTVCVALPAASLGLGCGFTPARKLLDAGSILAIATDWNPGSAPMGKLLESASILATMEKLSNAELFAGITFRAAKALNLSDRGRLDKGFLADFVIYETDNYQMIPYLGGNISPLQVWKNGALAYSTNE